MTGPQRPESPCPDCWHEPHPLRRCPEIVGSSGAPMPDPVYCECANVGAMEAEIRRLTARAAERTETAGLREARDNVIEAARNLANLYLPLGESDIWHLRTAVDAYDAALAVESSHEHVPNWNPEDPTYGSCETCDVILLRALAADPRPPEPQE